MLATRRASRTPCPPPRGTVPRSTIERTATLTPDSKPVRTAAIVFVLALLPTLRVAGDVDLAALMGIDLVLALQSEHRVAEADLVPVGARARALVHAGAAGKTQEQS